MCIAAHVNLVSIVASVGSCKIARNMRQVIIFTFGDV